MTGTLANMLPLVVVLAAAAAAALCAAAPLDSGSPSKEDGRIIDGEPACRDQFRHHARIEGDDRMSFGGSLIKPTAILTKGRDVARFKKFTIRLGTIFRLGDDSAVTVQSIWALAHPEVDTGTHIKNDIAVILLNVEIPLGKSIWPVKLPSFDEVDETFTGRRALISGFGPFNTTGPTRTDRLQFAEVTVISNDLCKRFFEEDYITDSTLCAGNDKNALCNGDYGGALVIKTGGQYKQIGIASFHTNYCKVGIPGAYARVTSYLEWIKRVVGDLDDWGAAEDSYFN